MANVLPDEPNMVVTMLAMTWQRSATGEILHRGLVDLLPIPLASSRQVLCSTGYNAEPFFQLVDTGLPTLC